MFNQQRQQRRHKKYLRLYSSQLQMDSSQEAPISYCLHNGSNTLIETEEGRTILELGGSRNSPPPPHTPALFTPIVLQPIQLEPQNFVIHGGDHWTRNEHSITAFKTVCPSKNRNHEKLETVNWRAMAKLSDMGKCN